MVEAVSTSETSVTTRRLFQMAVIFIHIILYLVKGKNKVTIYIKCLQQFPPNGHFVLTQNQRHVPFVLLTSLNC
jgi:hypothetical protein